MALDGGEYNVPSVFPGTGTNTASAIQSLNAAGVSVFVSSGNEGHDNGISFPACVAEAISVGGVYDAAPGRISWCGNPMCTTILCTDNPTAADSFASTAMVCRAAAHTCDAAEFCSGTSGSCPKGVTELECVAQVPGLSPRETAVLIALLAAAGALFLRPSTSIRRPRPQPEN